MNRDQGAPRAGAPGTLVVPQTLTRVAAKRDMFAGDPYFRDAWDDYTAMYAADEAALAQLHRVAPLVLRADAIAARRGRTVLAAVGCQGFFPVAWAVLRFDRHITREVWRYQLNIATRERIDVMDMILPAEDSLYVLFRDIAAPGIPATTRLSEMKGPSRPEARQAHHLRRIAGATQASVLTYVHIPDEPADILRELGIFFDRDERIRLMRAVRSADDVSEDVVTALASLEQRSPAPDMSWRAALDRLERLLPPQRSGCDEAAYEALRAQITAIRSGQSRDWRMLLRMASDVAAGWAHWDQVVVAAELSTNHLDADPIIPDVDRMAWLPSAALPCAED